MSLTCAVRFVPNNSAAMTWIPAPVGIALTMGALRPRPKAKEGGDSDSWVNMITILSGLNRQSNSSDFRGGDLTAFMGGGKLDLREAKIVGEAELHIFAMWGGFTILVPEDWSVSVRAVPLLGGWEDNSKSPAAEGESEQRLIVTGWAIMGGFEVKN